MRVAIAEDSVLLREGLVRLLEDAGCDVVGQSADADDLMLKVRSFAPDVAVVDIRLPPTHNDEGLRAALEIRSKHPDVGVLVLSQYVEVGLALTLLADSAEGVGYLLKDRIRDIDEFVGAVRRVAEGGSALDPIIVTTLLSRQRPDDPISQLSPPGARDPGADGDRELEPGYCGPARHHGARRREARLEHLRQARSPVDGKRVEARARRADVLAVLTSTDVGTPRTGAHNSQKT